MPDDRKPGRCPHCSREQTPSLLIRTHCEKCGKPLKTERRPWPEPGVAHRPQPSL